MKNWGAFTISLHFEQLADFVEKANKTMFHLQLMEYSPKVDTF